MMTRLHLSLLLLATLVSEHSCIQWSPSSLKQDAVVYACDNSDLTLSWDVSKTTGETIVDVQWYYEGRSQELIAMLAHGHLNVMPAFSGRVELTANAGLVIHHVTSGEKGNYSVEVNGMTSSGHPVILQSIAIVVIGEGPRTEGELHASQLPVAVFSNSTQQWHVALACGKFTYLDNPPFTLEWTTPSGQSVSSSQYKEGQFLLLLDNPVSGGSYACHVPQRSATVVCLHGNSTVSSTVVVDDVRSRLTLLEAENQRLKDRLAETTAQANDNKADVTQANARVNNVSSQLVQHLHDEKTKRVSFHATYLKDPTPSQNDVLIPTNVFINQGNGYNPSTGKFTAPINGTYCFMATLYGGGFGHPISVYLMADDKIQVRIVTTFDDSKELDVASLQAVVYVRAGQSVWLQAGGTIDFDPYPFGNSFSGFLINYDH